MKRLILGMGIMTLVTTGCSPDAVINQTEHIEGGAWGFYDVKRFSAEVTDTLTPYQFYLYVRHGGNYSYRNLIVIVKTYFPNNTFITDTIDCPLADPTGRWYGSGLGDLLDNRILFKRNVQMPAMGNYKFELQHAMRPDTIQEIYDIGLAIESAVD